MTNRYVTAFKENYNVFGLASAAAVSIAVMDIVPLAVGLVAEVVYLAVVPHSKWYSRRLANRETALKAALREAREAILLPQLHPQLRERFKKLEAIRADIEHKTDPEVIWMREVIRQLDYLLAKFLDFAWNEEQFRKYLTEAREDVEGPKVKAVLNRVGVPPRLSPDGSWIISTVELVGEAYGREIENLRAQQSEAYDRTQPILQKRIEVIERRRDHISKIGSAAINLHHQLALIEDSFGLIRDELLARPPEQVLADVSSVVSQTQTMNEVLGDLRRYEHLLDGMEVKG